MVDVLGFKGIWRDKSVDAKNLFDWMSLLALRLNNRGTYCQTWSGLMVKTTLLSDTAVIGIGFKDEDAPKLEGWGRALLAMGYMMNAIVQHWSMFIPSKNIRGCVTAGEFAMDQVFLLGSAVDEAASLYEQCEGAFIWLAPSADRYIEGTSLATVRNRHKIHWRDWDVPLKLGVYQTHVLDPLSYKGRIFKLGPTEVQSAMLSAFDSERKDISVQIKKQHTATFLDVCMGNLGS